jgi:hypothetical protein
MTELAIKLVPWEAVRRVAECIPANKDGVPVNPRRLEVSLNNIKRGIMVRGDDFDHVDQRDLWRSVENQIDELKKALERAGQQRIHKTIFGSEGLIDNLGRIEQVNNWARLRLKFFDDLSKARRGGRAPAREYAYAALTMVWREYGQVPSTAKDGPFYRFLCAACKALEVKVPDGENMRNIAARYRSVT